MAEPLLRNLLQSFLAELKAKKMCARVERTTLHLTCLHAVHCRNPRMLLAPQTSSEVLKQLWSHQTFCRAFRCPCGCMTPASPQVSNPVGLLAWPSMDTCSWYFNSHMRLGPMETHFDDGRQLMLYFVGSVDFHCRGFSQ